MNRRLLVPLVLAAAASLAVPAPHRRPRRQANPIRAVRASATVKIEVGHLHGGKARILSTVPVSGTVRPFAPGSRSTSPSTSTATGSQRKTVRVRKGAEAAAPSRRASSSRRRASTRSAPTQRPAARSAATPPCARAGGSASPALHQGECGDVVVGLQEGDAEDGLRRRTAAPASTAGPAAGCSPTAKSTGWPAASTPARAWSSGVFAGRGGYRVRHPDAGEHAEVPLSKQVLVFAKGDRPFADLPGLLGQVLDPDDHRPFNFYQARTGLQLARDVLLVLLHGGYAVHGYESVPDYPASHGCIRTFIADQPRDLQPHQLRREHLRLLRLGREDDRRASAQGNPRGHRRLPRRHRAAGPGRARHLLRPDRPLRDRELPLRRRRRRLHARLRRRGRDRRLSGPAWRAPLLWLGALWYGFHAINHAFDTGEAKSEARGWSDTLLIAFGGVGVGLAGAGSERLNRAEGVEERMRVFVAGASGAIGRPLVRAAGRGRARGDRNDAARGACRGDPRAAGATAVVCDVFDAAALREAVDGGRRPRSSSTSSQACRRATSPARPPSTRRPTGFAAREARNLLEAALAAGARRFLTQSICFLYAPGGRLGQGRGGAARSTTRPATSARRSR